MAERVNLDESKISEMPTLELRSPKGKLKIVPEPAGTRGGYDDLRRAATQEPIGKVFASRSPQPPTSRACSPPSDAKRTCEARGPSAPTGARTAGRSRARPLTPSGPRTTRKSQRPTHRIAGETQNHPSMGKPEPDVLLSDSSGSHPCDEEMKSSSRNRPPPQPARHPHRSGRSSAQ